MKKTPVFLTFQPIFKERIWGGRELEKLGFKIPDGNIGECWGISAHQHGMSIVDQGPYKGLTLEEIYKKYPHWFNDEKKACFPLLIKILDAREDLSVQVHPNDEFALKYEYEFGKHESWYVLDAKPNTRIQIGHHMTNKQSLFDLINKSAWDTFLHYYPDIYKGDVIDIPPGTLHALCAGSLIFEVQQNSDISYRLFDYNRVDKNGTKRELHLSKALEVINIPDNYHLIKHPLPSKYNQFLTLIENNKFILRYLKISENPFNLKNNKYLCGYLLSGSLLINQKSIKSSKFFIIPSKAEPITLQGECELLIVEAK